jgi:hypothetical protein
MLPAPISPKPTSASMSAFNSPAKSCRCGREVVLGERSGRLSRRHRPSAADPDEERNRFGAALPVIEELGACLALRARACTSWWAAHALLAIVPEKTSSAHIRSSTEIVVALILKPKAGWRQQDRGIDRPLNSA